VQPNGAASPTTRNHIARLNSDGSLDTTFNPDATSYYANSSQVYAIALQSNGYIVIGGAFTGVNNITRNHIARLTPTGAVDMTFDPNANAMVAALYVQSNGQILVGGGFVSFQPNGAASPTTRSGIARLNSNGTLDPNFDPETNDQVVAIQVQLDGKILIGGAFSLLDPGLTGGTTNVNSIARLNSDGSIDTSFLGDTATTGVSAIALTPDGKIVLGGLFTSISDVNGSYADRFTARLNADGTQDGTYDPSPNYAVNAIAVQTDGKIILGGQFDQVQPDVTAIGIYRNGIARINYDGTLDTNFNPNAYGNISAAGVQTTTQTVNGVTQTTVTGIIIGGNFSTVGGLTRRNLARLLPSGAVDPSFDPEPDGNISAIAVLPNGQVLIGGNFQTFSPPGSSAPITRSYLARLNANGSLDNTFDPEPNSLVDAITLQPNGQILVGGGFAGFTPNSGSIPAPITNSTTTTTNITTSGNTATTTTVTTTSTSTITVVTTSSTVSTTTTQSNGQTIVSTPVTTTTTVTTTTPLSGGTATTTTTTTVLTEALYVARLNTDGSVDTTFLPSPNGNVTGILLEPSDNAVILIGNINLVNPVSTNVTSSVNDIFRVSMTDGSLDTTFNPNPSNVIETMALQPNGQIIIGGPFSSLTPNPVETTTVTPSGVVVLVTPPTLENGIARLNVDGTVDTTFSTNLSEPITVYTLAINPTSGQMMVGGIFSSPGSATQNDIARLNSDGTVDSTFSSSVNGVVDQIQFLPDGSGQILAVGAFTGVYAPGSTTITATAHAALFNSNGTLDTAFDPGVGASAQINEIALQLDGELILGGNFANVDGSYATNIVRLFSDTDFDSTLALNADGPVNAIAVQPDGSLFVGGNFNGIGLTTNSSGNTISAYSPNFVHVDGSTSMVDATYESALPDGAVNAIAVQPADGKVIIGGAFNHLVTNSYNTGSATVVAAASRLARINTNGSVDTGFTGAVGGGNVNSVLVQPTDGRILIAGTFTNVDGLSSSSSAVTIGGASHAFLARLNTDGSVDTGFNPQVSAPSSQYTSFYASALVLQPNGQILVGGYWSIGAIGASSYKQGVLMRFNSNGALDSTFTSPVFSTASSSSTSVNALVLVGDGTILAGGSFGLVNGTAINNLAHFSSTGVLDASYDPNPDGSITSLALQMDGKVYVAGGFDTIGGQIRNGIARLIGPTTQIVQSIGISNNLQTIAWSRGGPGPEPIAVYFQSSTDDNTWTTLGPASVGVLTQAQAAAQTSITIGGNEIWSYTISGASTLPGSTNFFIRAVAIVPTSEGGSSGTVQFSTEFYVAPPPDFSGATSVNAVAGSLFYYQIAGAYPATSFAASGLPPGLTINSSTGVIAGTPTQAGTYTPTLTLTNPSGTTVVPNSLVPSFTITVAATTPSGTTGPTARLINLSSLSVISNGGSLTDGLSIVGPAPKAVLLQAIGPGLAVMNVTQFIPDPVLQVYDQYGRVILTNSVWDPTNASAANLSDLMAISAQLGANALTAANNDCAVVTTLPPGSYTVKVTSAGGNTGTVLLAAYDADANPLAVPTRFFNISGNGSSSPGNPLISGFTIEGSTPKTVLIRGIGPSLFNYGVLLPVPDPVLSLYDHKGNLLAQNTGWQNPTTSNSAYPAATAAAITAADSSAYAFALTSANADSAVLVTLPPGSYTAQVTSVSGTAGPALCEIFEVPGSTGN
jgi:uncharacterized delta-60 repeat protein